MQNRRNFIKHAAAGTAALSAMGPAATGRTAGIKASPVRIATIQTGRIPNTRGLQTDPFKPGFSMAHLNRSIDARLDWYEELFARAARERCRLAVVTEDFTGVARCHTFLDDRSIFQNAVDRQTPLVAERVAAAARKHRMYIVACYFAREGERIYNVADLVGPDGSRIGRYRKVHLPQYELWQVTAGDAFPAFETELGWIGMLICYDQMWPESVACCAMNGAQLICQPSAARLQDYHMQARSHDNQVHMISSTWNHSLITSPRAEILADAGTDDPAIVWADVDLKNATLADEYFYEYLYSGIQDHKERHLKFRRPETYAVLTEQQPPLAQQYAPGGRADTPEKIQQVYETLKKIRQGHPDYQHYHWRW
jgi:predicted amidohydrolase